MIFALVNMSVHFAAGLVVNNQCIMSKAHKLSSAKTCLPKNGKQFPLKHACVATLDEDPADEDATAIMAFCDRIAHSVRIMLYVSASHPLPAIYTYDAL